MRMRWFPWLAVGVLAQAAEPSPTPAPPDADDLYKVGQQLFDQFAPPEVKDQFAFPSKDEWDRFSVRLQHALDNNSLEELAAFEPEARSALAALRALPGYEDYADWLELRIDEIGAAKEAVAQSGRPAPTRPGSPGSEAALFQRARRRSCRSFARPSPRRACRPSSRGSRRRNRR
jgi:membrane-bound lytic murein transglycosylase D